MTDLPGAERRHQDDDPAIGDDAERACPYCGAARDPARSSSGVCPACGQWDPDDASNRDAFLAWTERTRRAAGQGESDDPTRPQEVEKDDARR